MAEAEKAKFINAMSKAMAEDDGDSFDDKYPASTNLWLGRARVGLGAIEPFITQAKRAAWCAGRDATHALYREAAIHRTDKLGALEPPEDL